MRQHCSWVMRVICIFISPCSTSGHTLGGCTQRSGVAFLWIKIVQDMNSIWIIRLTFWNQLILIDKIKLVMSTVVGFTTPMQSVPITDHWCWEFESRPKRGVQHNVIKVCQWLETGRWFSSGPPISSTTKTDRHDITEILWKVALNTIKPNHINCFTGWERCFQCIQDTHLRPVMRVICIFISPCSTSGHTLGGCTQRSGVAFLWIKIVQDMNSIWIIHDGTQMSILYTLKATLSTCKRLSTADIIRKVGRHQRGNQKQ
jgi:hypothetical protein